MLALFLMKRNVRALHDFSFSFFFLEGLIRSADLFTSSRQQISAELIYIH